VAQKFHFAILRIEVTRASRGLSAIAQLLVNLFHFPLLRITKKVAFQNVRPLNLCAPWSIRPNSLNKIWRGPRPGFWPGNSKVDFCFLQEAQLSQRDRATRYVSWNLANSCAIVWKITLKRPAIQVHVKSQLSQTNGATLCVRTNVCKQRWTLTQLCVII